jgi:hypothetical protein
MTDQIYAGDFVRAADDGPEMQVKSINRDKGTAVCSFTVGNADASEQAEQTETVDLEDLTFVRRHSTPAEGEQR